MAGWCIQSVANDRVRPNVDVEPNLAALEQGDVCGIISVSAKLTQWSMVTKLVVRLHHEHR